MYPDMTPLDLLHFFGEAREMAPSTMKNRIEAVVDLCALELVLEKPRAGKEKCCLTDQGSQDFEEKIYPAKTQPPHS